MEHLNDCLLQMNACVGKLKGIYDAMESSLKENEIHQSSYMEYPTSVLVDEQEMQQLESTLLASKSVKHAQLLEYGNEMEKNERMEIKELKNQLRRQSVHFQDLSAAQDCTLHEEYEKELVTIDNDIQDNKEILQNVRLQHQRLKRQLNTLQQEESSSCDQKENENDIGNNNTKQQKDQEHIQSLEKQRNLLLNYINENEDSMEFETCM